MSRIGADHLAREAIVYVRQSTIDQVINNVESRRRQYGLVERARQLGWANVNVIDDDLGRSGSGVCRPGFEKHTALCVRRNRTGQHRWRVDADVVELVRAMARQMPDMGIAAALNRAGKTTGKGNSWTRSRVASLRNDHSIAAYRRRTRRARRGDAERSG